MAGLALSLPTQDDLDLLYHLQGKARRAERELMRLKRYRDGEQRLRQIGLATPPELRMFETVVNVPGMAVNEPVSRQQIRAFVRTDATSDKPDPVLQEIANYNNLDAQQIVCHSHERAFGRGIITVSGNEYADEPPIIKVESPIGWGLDVDRRLSQVTAAARTYRDDDNREAVTLMTPDATLWMSRDALGRWKVDDRDDHQLGEVPVVMPLNRQWQRTYEGRSEMHDVMGMTDAIARMVTNVQVTGESLALPHRWAAGVSEDDFVDEHGNPIPAWEAYMTAMRVTENKDAKFGSFSAADLSNFTKAVNELLVWCGSQLGLPTRYMGQESVNPASEGAIVADEARLIRNVEKMNLFDGVSWSWTMGLVERVWRGTDSRGNSIRTIWHDPATPTYSQRADAVIKLRSQGALSREGMWDEMGWSEERKARERQNLAAEAAEARSDPALAQYMQMIGGGSGGGSDFSAAPAS